MSTPEKQETTTVAGPEYGSRSPSRQSRGSRNSGQNARTTSASPETRQSSSRDSQRSRSSARKQPSYEETSLQISGSPPLTSFLNDRHSASSEQEEAYLRHASRLRMVRLVLSVVTIATALAAVGVEGHVLSAYNNTRLGKEWYLPLWPIDIDVRPTLGILIPAAIVALLSVSYLIVAVVPSPHSRTTLLQNTFLLTSTLATILSVIALTFSPTLTYTTDPSSSRPTIHSHTCTLYRQAQSFNSASANMGIPIFGEGMAYPLGFKRICVETEVGIGLMGVVGVVALGSLGVGIWGFWRGRGIERGRRERWGEKYAREV